MITGTPNKLLLALPLVVHVQLLVILAMLITTLALVALLMLFVVYPHRYQQPQWIPLIQTLPNLFLLLLVHLIHGIGDNKEIILHHLDIKLNAGK